MKCCVIQLARIGDLAQSVMLLRALAESGRNVELVCAADPGQWIRSWCKVIHVLDTRELLKHQDSPLEILKYLRQNLSELYASTFEECYCLNETTPARLLAQGIAAADNFGFCDSGSPAEAWFQSLGQWRPQNTIHLSEWQLALNPDLPAEVNAVRFRTQGDVLVHYGSGSSYRQLSVDFWNNLLGDLQQRFPDRRILLSGSGSEAEFCAWLADQHSQALSIAGRTSLDELLEVIENCAAVLAQDTGILHLAALTATPVFGLYYGSARATETGPFQHGARVLQIIADCHPCLEGSPSCGNHDCQNWFVPATVAECFADFTKGIAARELTDKRMQLLDVDLGPGYFQLRKFDGEFLLEDEVKLRQLEWIKNQAPLAVSNPLLADAKERSLSHADYMRRLGTENPAGLEETAQHFFEAALLGSKQMEQQR